MKVLPEASLVLHGRDSGPDRDRVQRLARELGVDHRISFRSSDRSELATEYAAADVCVFPSEWDEPFGLVPLEAMACATPVVATGRGGSGEFLVDGYNCLLFPEGDASALAAAVQRLAANSAMRTRLKTAGAATAGYFDVDRLADGFDAWHAAAARSFDKGRPADRTRPGDVASAEGARG
jgi:glycosyltransferase involved in cell wall biosynthesis